MLLIEFFGIPRSRAGVADVELRLAANEVALEAVYGELARRFPQLGRDCFEAGRLRTGFAANLNGERFVSDGQTRLRDGDSLLIMSADAGG